MERRKFIKASAIGSTCILTGSLIPDTFAGNQDIEYTCKITVIRKMHNKEWSKEFMNSEGAVCDLFSEGQEFIVKSPWEVPEGFCPWAWGDIRTLIHLVHAGKFQTFVTCCTDGFRPVFFKIERIKK